MSNHTPGPWKIISGNADRAFHAASIRPVTSPIKGVVLPIASVRYVREPFGRANARLIAAAPELLEAMQGVMYWDNGKPEWDAARAAIAKATGEQA